MDGLGIGGMREDLTDVFRFLFEDESGRSGKLLC